MTMPRIPDHCFRATDNYNILDIVGKRNCLLDRISLKSTDADLARTRFGHRNSGPMLWGNETWAYLAWIGTPFRRLRGRQTETIASRII